MTSEDIKHQLIVIILWGGQVSHDNVRVRSLDLLKRRFVSGQVMVGTDIPGDEGREN